MKFAYSLVVLTCVLWEGSSYPYYPAYGNVDSVSYGSMDATRGGVALSRYYSPYYAPRAGGAGMAAFMFPQEPIRQSGQYYMPDRRRQTNVEYAPPQQNEIPYYPQQAEQQPEIPVSFQPEPTELADPTEKTELIPTTAKAIVPELAEGEGPEEVEEVEEATPKPKKAVVSWKKQTKKPIDDEDEEEFAPKMPTGAFFPMFFYGGRSGAGGPGGPTAIANAYSTGRGGVATSHATAYGAPRPDTEYGQQKYRKN